MDIDFMVGIMLVKFICDWFWGGMKLVSVDEIVWVQYLVYLGMYFFFIIIQFWLWCIVGQEVIVEKICLILFVVFCEQCFCVLVNGIEVVNCSGMQVVVVV